MTSAPITKNGPKGQLSLFDSSCIIVGIIIGATIYESSPRIAQNVESPAWLLGVWLCGGLLAFIGSLCYAELATAFPREGGDYAYLSKAFGRRLGLLFAWAELWVVRPGSIGAMAFIFARYARQLTPQWQWHPLWYAAGAIAVLTAINLLGVREGKWTQNVLTTVKVAGLLAICAFGLLGPTGSETAAAAAPTTPPDLRQAFIFVLFAYGGWNEMAYVAAEVRHPQRNILLALVVGALAVTMIYLLATLSFLRVAGLDGLRASQDIAGAVIKPLMGDAGQRTIAVLIAVSALGAINGMLFTGARIFYALGEDHPVLAWLGRWNARRGTPSRALALQAGITLAVVVLFGRAENGFGNLVNFTAPVYWLFAACVAVSVFLLRRGAPDAPRPYRTPLFPLLPAVFLASCLFLFYSSVSWAMQNQSAEAFWAVGLLALGVVVCLFSPMRKK